jgi:2-enoate reductase
MKLFEKGQIGNMILKNRIVMDAINIQQGLPCLEAPLGQRAFDFYAARAKGGVGLIKTTFMLPTPDLEVTIGGPSINNKRAGQWLNELAQTVHDYGAKLCVQLSIGLGRIIAPDRSLPHGGLVGPSPLPSFRDPYGNPPKIAPGKYPIEGEEHVTTRELTTKEVEQLVKDFEFSARIVALAEVDCIEIHGHQGYLLDEFMTSLWNKRTDKYGGDLNGRLRLAIELVEAIRAAAGADYPILFKYPLTHFLDGGRTIEEGIEIAKRLEAAGANALTINAGCYETYNLAQPPTTSPRGGTLHLAELARKAVKIPIISSSKLGYPDLAERALQEEKLDFVALARYLLADPEWANKVKEGRTEDIIPCVGCHEGCINRVRRFHYCSCAVNPATGAERELAINVAEKKKVVLVIGGGPGGMEAARVSALRGHEVVLWDKAKDLGGNLIPAAVPDFKGDYKLLIEYLKTQIRKLDVKVELNKEARPEIVRNLNPDVVFVATGAVPMIPEIEGMRQGIEKGKVVTAIEALLDTEKVGFSAVIIGGGLIGCETALCLARQGKKVTVVEMLDTLAGDMAWGNALELVKFLDDEGVFLLTKSKAIRVAGYGIDYLDESSAEKKIHADTVVIATGLRSSGQELIEELEKMVPEVIPIGDCVKPRKVLSAMWEGYRRARVI